MCPFLAFVTRTSDVTDGEAVSDVPDDSPAVEDGISLALSRPFIFLGLTICGLLGALLLLIYSTYRIIKCRQMKRGASSSRRQCSLQNPSHDNALRSIESVVDTRSKPLVVSRLPSLFDNEKALDPNRSVRGQTKISRKITEAPTQYSENMHDEHEIHRNRSQSLVGNNGRPLATIRLVNAGTTVDPFAHHLPLQRHENDCPLFPPVVYNKKVSRESHSSRHLPPGEFPFNTYGSKIKLTDRNGRPTYPENRIRRSRGTFHLVKAEKGFACTPHLAAQTENKPRQM